MEIIKHTTGRASGRISVLNTLKTMDVGEVWIIDADEVKFSTAYTTCSEYQKETNTSFSVSRIANKGKLTITRTL